MVRLYFDHHIHLAIVDELRKLGVHCLTAEEDERRDLSDVELLDRASALGYVLVSNDEDFHAIAADRWASGVRFGGIIRLDQNKLTIGQAIENLQLITAASEADEWVDQLVYLPL